MEFKVSISRSSNGKINISVEEVNSRVQFLDMEMEPANFANCVTGLSCQTAHGDARFLEYVGKFRLSERRKATIPFASYNRERIERWVMDNCQDEGWIISNYLGGRGDIVTGEDFTVVHYTATKFVETV